MTVSKISRYRNEIMGVAIVWVMLFHSQIDLSRIFWPAGFIKLMGYAGADIFFFLSGFGLYHGYRAVRLTTFEFYTVRLSKILPAYWIMVTVYFLVEHLAWGTYSSLDWLFMLTGLNFFVQEDKILWFIPALACFYAMFLCMVRWAFEQGRSVAVKRVGIGIAAAVALSIVITLTDLHYLLIMTIRFPVFILGIYAGYLHVTEQKSFWFGSAGFNGLVMVFGLALLVLIVAVTPYEVGWRYGVGWYPFIVLTYPLCLMIALALDWLSDSAGHSPVWRMLKSFLSLCGRYSLEIFLIHVVLFATVPEALKAFLPWAVEHPINFLRIPEYGILALAAVCSAPVLNRITAPVRYRSAAVRRGDTP